MPNLTMADYAALAEAGHDECGRFLPAIGAVMADAEGAVPDETLVPSDHNPHGDKGMTYGAVRAFLQTMGSDADAHYSVRRSKSRARPWRRSACWTPSDATTSIRARCVPSPKRRKPCSWTARGGAAWRSAPMNE